MKKYLQNCLGESFHTLRQVFHKIPCQFFCTFQKESLSLSRLSVCWKPLGDHLRWDTYILKAFSGRFGFDALRISQIQTDCQNQSNGNAPWRCSINGILYNNVSSYIHPRGAFSVARFRLSGQCESLQNVDRAQNWLHVFCLYALTLIITTSIGAERDGI